MTAGAIAAKIAAGAAAVAIIGYGAVGVAMYSENNSKIDVRYRQEMVDSSPYTHITPHEPILLSNPTDNSDKYEYVDYESVSEKVSGTIPLQFIDDTQLLVFVPDDYENINGTNYIYDFYDDTLTEIVTALPPITEKPLSVQYMDSNNYYIVYDYYRGKQSDANGRYALHITDKKVYEEYDYKALSYQKLGIAIGGKVFLNFSNGKMLSVGTNNNTPDDFSDYIEYS